MPGLFDLSGRTAVITGANTGLGQGIAVALAAAGAGIVAVGRSGMDETEALCAPHGTPFRAIRADLAFPLDPYKGGHVRPAVLYLPIGIERPGAAAG